MVMTPAEFHAHIEKEITMNSAVVKAAGIKAN
jgi:tripartite-type tricarboxylate transporter receptor subunit TctC